MKLEDLKVIDIIQMPQFEKHIEALIKDLYLIRTNIMNGSLCVQFKRGPIERLQEKKVFGPKALAALYAKVVDKAINQQANMQHINAQFAEIKQPLSILEK